MAKVIAEICLYGTTQTGAGYLVQTASGKMLGTGEPVKGRSFTDAMWAAMREAEAAEVFSMTATFEPIDIVHVFHPGGESMSKVKVTCRPYFEVVPAPVYVIPISQLLDASGR